MKLPSKDFLSGLLFVAIGAATALISAGYRMGHLNAMGPGFFPFWLGVILVVFGAVVVFGAGVAGATGEVGPDQRLDPWNLKGLALVVIGVVLFGLLLDTFGLVAAITALVIVGSFASSEFSLLPTIANAFVLSTLAVLLFGYGLGLELPIWPAFLTN